MIRQSMRVSDSRGAGSAIVRAAGATPIAAAIRPTRGGDLEVLGAVLVLLPTFSLYGAVVLLGALVTAIHTHVARERVPKNSLAAVLLALVVLLGLLRGPQATGVGGTVFRAMFG